MQAVKRGPKSWIWLAVRLLVAALALGWTFSMAPWREVMEAASAIAPLSFALGVALMLGNMWIGAIRWHALLAAYGAERVPRLPFLARAYWIGTFYNTLLPANVSGDVVRGHVTRQSFPESNAAAYVIVAIERFFGLAGLILVVVLVLSFHPVAEVSVPPALALVAAGVAVGAAMSPLLAARIGRVIPGRIGEALVALPRPTAPLWFGPTLGLSLVTHSVASLVVWVMLRDLHPTVELLDILVLMPLALMVIYVPITVAGLGVREVAFVGLLGEIGVNPVDATVCSLAFMGVMLVISMGGGLSHLVAPLDWEFTPPGEKEAEGDRSSDP